jgi:exosortase
MIPIPAIIYSQITFPLQMFASQVAERALDLLGVPVYREGNILELPSQKLSVVEACSGIRSLLSLSFLSLAYGFFCERRVWVRWLLFFMTVPIAVATNAGRVTATGLVSEYDPELAKGIFHTLEGIASWAVAMVVLWAFHFFITRFLGGDKQHAAA